LLAILITEAIVGNPHAQRFSPVIGSETRFLLERRTSA
jgi:hypothetical protein